MLKSWKVVVVPDDRRNGEQFVMHAVAETLEGAGSAAKKAAAHLVQQQAGDTSATVSVRSVEQFAHVSQLVWDDGPKFPYVAGDNRLSMWEVMLSPDEPVMAPPVTVNVVAGDIHAAMAYAKKIAEFAFDHFEDAGVTYTPASAVLVAHRVQIAPKEGA